MDIDILDGFKKSKNKYEYKKKRPDKFITHLLKDIKHNGGAYVKSYKTIQEMLQYEKDLTYEWIKEDNLYLVRHNK